MFRTATTAASFRHLLAATAFGLLLGCEPPEEPEVLSRPESVRLQPGDWSLRLTDARLEGRCAGLSARDFADTRIGGTLHITPELAVFDLEGVILEGRYERGVLSVEGSPDMGGAVDDVDVDESPPEPGEDGDTIDSDDGDAGKLPPAPCLAPEETEPGTGTGGGSTGPGGGGGGGASVWLGLDATAVSATELKGELWISYDLPDMDCEVVLAVAGQQVGRDDRPDEDKPVPLVETEDMPVDEGDCGDADDC